ncbi:MAG: DUF2085 domain-containing protein [Chloroflexota bacterium]
METAANFIGKSSKWLVIVAAALVFFGWLMVTPSGLFGKADAVGYAVCHRIDVRSFHVDGRALPLCARCSGMYLGAVLGLGFQWLAGRRRTGVPPWTVIAPLALLVVAFGVDGSNSYLYLLKETQPGALAGIPNLYVPNNTLRLFTGSGMGLAMAAALFPAFNQTVWRDREVRPALDGLKPFGLLLLLTLVLDLLVLTESPVVLYPAALISAGGVLALLSMVYSVVWVTIMKKDNQYENLTELWLPLVAGFTIAVLQIAAIDLFRFWLTGTWGEFPLG